MEEFINALTSASVLAGVFLTVAVQVVFKRTPIVFKKFRRGVRLRHLRKVRPLRHNQDAVTFESIKTSAYFLLFCGSAAFFLILVSMGPLSAIVSMPQWVFFIFLSPVLVVEIMWLLQKNFTKSLIKHRGRLRVTSSSSGRLRRSLS